MGSRIGTGLFLLSIIMVFLVWAAYFELDQTVRTQGQLIPQDRTQVVQVADGGVLEKLYVTEGQIIKSGQVLATLEKERASAGLDEVENRLANLNIMRLRALAEANNTVPHFHGYSARYPAMVQVQQDLYNQNQSALKQELEAFSAALSLANEEYQLTKRLQEMGDVSRLELMRTERQLIEIKQKQQSLRDKYRSDARREIAKIEEELTTQKSRFQERKSVLDHTDILSPMDGVVKYLRINTLGGVLRAGDELMQISPTEGGYIIEAKLNPTDIGQLSLGLPVTVRLDTFDYSTHGALKGELTYISSDTLSEQSQDGRGAIYYRARIRINDQQTNNKLKLTELKPGMTATLDIQTGKRSVLKFIFKPILRAFSGAFTQK